MKTRSISLFVAVGLLGATGEAVLVESPSFAQSSTAGAVRGVVKDKSTGEAVIGATVVASGPALQGQQAEITDENGAYTIDNLPPGTYTLTVFYNDAQFDRPNVLIQVGKEAVVNIKVSTAEATGGEVIQVESRAPIVDQGSTKTGTTITSEYTENVPVGRTFGAVLGAASGSQGDTYGVSFSGSESVESTYVVEGLDTTDAAFGGISSNLPNEFIQETEVITGGYNAEFGHSIGGVVNVVTKSGSNDFHGEIYGYYTPGQLVASAKEIQRDGETISTKTDLNNSFDVGAEVGGPIVKDKVWFHIGVNPSQRNLTTQRIVNAFQDDPNNPGNNLIDPNTGFSVTKEVDHTDIPVKYTTEFFTGKLTGALGQNHQWQVSAWGNPRSGTDVFIPETAVSRQTAHYKDGAFDGSAKWTSKFADGKTELDIVAGFHRGYSNQDPIAGNGSSGPHVFYHYQRSLTDFTDYEPQGENLADCMPTATEQADGFTPCPVIDYGIGGLGFVDSRTNDRLNGQAAVQQRVKAAGYHTFKLGVDVDENTSSANRGYTGGEEYRVRASGNWRRQTFITYDPTNAPGDVPCFDFNDDGVPDAMCTELPRMTPKNNSHDYSAYLQDSWQIKPNLTLNAGLRYEEQTGDNAKFLQGTKSATGETVPSQAYKLSNEWAPRIGLIYDPTQEGRAKIFGHWGRFYEEVPLDMGTRSFGGEIFHTQAVLAGNCPQDGTNTSALNQCFADQANNPNVIDGGILGTGEFFIPGTKGQYLDEGILGAEYEFLPDFKMGINYIHRTLPNVIEDMSADNANYYVIGNPGADYTSEAASLRATGDAMLSDTDTSNDSLGNEFESRAFNVGRVSLFDKPSRNYDGVQITADQRFSKNALLMASYTYSRELGNYPGLFSTETGQLDPNITSMYDLQGLMSNRYGAMGIDRPHNLKIDGFYQFDMKSAGLLVVGASFRAQSGIPQNTLGAHFIYGPEESYLLERGAISRLPATWEADLQAQYGHKIGKGNQLGAFIDVFNLFNNQTEVSRDEQYTQDSENPIVGGDQTDLQHGKILSGDDGSQTNATPAHWKNFGHPTANQSPLSIRFGLRFTF